MNTSLILSNIGVYSLQAALLIGVGLTAVWLLRLRRPLGFLQLLLLAVLLLPVLQPWSRPVVRASRVSPQRVTLPVSALTRTDAAAPWDWPAISLAALGAGVVLRLGWVGLGLLRLRGLRRYAEDLGDGLAVSTEIDGPVTFGFWRPVILLPPAVIAMPESVRRAVLAHEREHVRRRDWLFALAEELVLCGLWFHPAVWLLVARIRLAREQVVDREASRAAGSRETYIDALLAVAGVRMQPYIAPAPPFLRRRQLASRVQALLSEVPMSRMRLISSYGAAALCTLALGMWVTGSMPLRGAPQVAEAAPDYASVQGAELLYSTRPVYPMAARRGGVEGTVNVELTLSPQGEVTDARVVSGAQELRKAALDAVLHWQFKPGPGAAAVQLTFRSPSAGTRPFRVTINAIDIDPAVPPALAQTLRARLQPFVGQPETGEVGEIIRRLDPSLRTRMSSSRNADMYDIRVLVERSDGVWGGAALAPNRIRVGGPVQAANLESKVDPAYPPLAKQARIQGTVRFNIGIGRDGGVVSLEVVNGHPLLIPAAAEAVRQYRYKPTLLNGQPVEVTTQVDVNFTL